jgi:branched-chain amino acid transport system ATP-binding protein
MLLEIRNLWVRYEGAEVLKGISCSIEEGTIVTFLGSNGAGKSTTVRAICGLKAPDSGEIWFKGERIDKLRPQNIIKRGIGHVPEGIALFPYMSVLENLKVGAYLQKDKKQADANLREIFTHFPILEERQKQQARTLSGGEQQMLAIARALMGSPKLLLLDEPTLGLSPMMVGEIGEIVRDIHKRGVSVILVEQNARLALGVADSCYLFETGSIAMCGLTKDLMDKDEVRKFYLGL